MYLEKISLTNFKNYSELELAFSPQINIITGPNGSGKTNLLDAIYYLSLTKSAFNSQDNLNIRHQENFFAIHAHIIKEKELNHIQCSLIQGQKKVFKLNKILYEKLSEHIGQFPVVLITPYDTDIIREGSEERRKFFDTILSQLDHHYLSSLIKYTGILKQRNSLLKQFNERNFFDKDLLEVYDHELINLSKELFKVRAEFIREFWPVFLKHYNNLSEEKEVPTLDYESHAADDHFESNFRHSMARDLLLQRTSKGIHKDDFVFKLDGFALKGFGSQGQHKSYVIALKLAQYDIIKEKKKFKPVLLLDDIFDKLDNFRIKKLMEMVSNKNFGQLFITDARTDRTEKFIKELKVEIRIFKIDKAKIEAIE